MTVTKDQAQMLATLAAAARPHGARRWDLAGTMAAIEKVRDRNLGDVILATIRAAADRDVETPGVIPTNGSHWHEQLAPQPFVPRVLGAGERCSTCSMTEAACRIQHGGNCGPDIDCSESPCSHHEFESAAEAAKRRAEADPAAVHTAIEALREDMPAMKPPTPPRTLEEIAETNPKLHERVEAVRAALPGPALREAEPEGEPA